MTLFRGQEEAGHEGVAFRALWVAHASRVLVSASRRNDLSFERRCSGIVADCEGKFAIARTRSPARETRALPKALNGETFAARAVSDGVRIRDFEAAFSAGLRCNRARSR